MSNAYVLESLTRLPKKDPDFSVYDIECSPGSEPGRIEGDLNTNFLGAGVFDGKSYQESKTAPELFDQIGAQPHPIAYAHNGSRYDLKYLLSALCESGREWDAAIAGSRVWLSVDRQNIWDSLAVLPAELRKLAAWYDCDTQKGEIDYEQIEKGPWREYLERDCRATHEVIGRAQIEIRDLGGCMKRSAASTAMTIFRRRYQEKPIVAEETAEPREREALFGGRCQIFGESFAGNVSVWDINSSYSRSALEEMPIRFVSMGRKPGYLHFGRGKIDMRDCAFGVVPHRRKRDGRLQFPINEILVGIWAEPEINLAEQCGAKVQIEEWYAYEPHPIFRGYALAMYEEKKKGSPSAKLLLNALYGRFALRRGREKLVGGLSEAPVVEVKEDGTKVLAPCLSENYGIYTLTENTNSFAAPAVFAWITALARVRLAKAIVQNHERILYCDTDSMILKGAGAPCGIEIGAELGQWKFEGEFDGFEALAPKVYRIGDTVKAKGMGRMKAKQFAQLKETGEARDVRMVGLKEMLREAAETATLKPHLRIGKKVLRNGRHKK
jgi:hypothetical protein